MLIVPVPMPEGVFVQRDTLHKCRHFVLKNGVWLAYANQYKSRSNMAAAYAGGPTISAIQQGMAVLRERKRRRKLKRMYP